MLWNHLFDIQDVLTHEYHVRDMKDKERKAMESYAEIISQLRKTFLDFRLVGSTSLSQADVEIPESQAEDAQGKMKCFIICTLVLVLSWEKAVAGNEMRNSEIFLNA